jgi:hypothetical protein
VTIGTAQSSRALEEVEDRLLVQANGTPNQVRKLRNEIMELIRDVRVSLAGNLQRRSSAYFMNNATCCFVVGCNDKGAMLTFEDYFGPSQLQHRRMHRSVPYLLTPISLTSSPDIWNSYFKTVLSQKIFTQLRCLMSGAQFNTLADSLSLNVRFGAFYLTHVDSALRDINMKMSIADLEDAISKNNTARKKYNRDVFDADTVASQRKHVAMTTLLPSQAAINSGGPKKAKHKNRPNFRSSFHSGACPLGEGQMVTALNCVGFSEYALTGAMLPRYKVSFIASTSFVVELRLDSRLDLVDIAEKPLRWVHATVIHGQKEPPMMGEHKDDRDAKSCAQSNAVACHMRINLETRESVPSSSGLFTLAYPTASNILVPPIEVSAQGTVGPHRDLPSESRRRLVFVRQVVTERFFSHCNGLKATISRGCNMRFKNGELVDTEKFTDLGVHVSSPVDVVHWLKGQGSASAANIWLDDALSVLLKLYDVIYKGE